MSQRDPERRVFPTASEDVAHAAAPTPSPQTTHPHYRLAFADLDFLLREDLRPVRFQLELLKPELILSELGIASTFIFYGSARVPEPKEAQARLAGATTAHERTVATNMVALSRYYDEARRLAQLVSSLPQEADKRQFVVLSGGGPSFMEAANRGARDVGAPSVALNIVLPHEQAPNEYVTENLSFQFHYFALRKMHFLMRARAVAVFPGGYGTLDELFETLTLIQTGKIEPLPVLLFGRAFWESVINFQALVDNGTISPKDVALFHFVETAEQAWGIVADHYGLPCAETLSAQLPAVA
jgi:uncharacterized protein (TIGR00730 family)